ncbi:MAG: glucosaminidase domain-containing protein [Lachnospiraceae bacterium]
MKNMRRNIILLIMVAVLCVPGLNVWATEAQDTYNDEQVTEEATDDVNEDTSTEAESEVAEEETPISEEELQELIEDAEENETITGMDEDGNVYEAELSDGLVEENLMTRAAAAQIVNFYTKSSSSTTSYTEVTTNTPGYTCGAYGADAAYLGTSGGKVKFMLGGVIGQVNASEVQVVSKSSAKSVSHYKVSSGKLYHYISTNLNNTSYGSTLLVGPAPSYLSSGVTYYSYDGHYFYTEANFGNMLDNYNSGTRSNSVNASNPYYNYFQYLPLRSTSSYSASTLTTAVNNKANSSTSKMNNTGSEFVSKQNTYGANALIMIGIGANESNWGKSNIAQTKNNLFGLNAVDSSPTESANYYSSVATCIKDFAETYLSKRYLRPGYTYYKGAFLGDKASGMNVSYASDPYWGEKAAAVAWNLDYDNGSKDANKYTIGIKDTMSQNHTNLNVRNGNSTSSTPLYQTGSQSNHSFLILDSTASNKFYKVQSDGVLNSGRTAINTSSGEYNFSSMYAYASSDYVTIVSKGDGSVPGTSGSNTGTIESPISVPSSVKNIISYKSHVQTFGWQDSVANGVMSGTMDLSKRMEAIQIKTSGVSNLGVKYSTHVQTYGWQDYVSDGATAGTTNESKRVEAIKIELTGSASTNYDLYYRVHVQNLGWLGWAESGDSAGSEGYSYRMEAIQIVVLPKGTTAPGTVGGAFKTKNAAVSYSAHVQTDGWQNEKYNGERSGTEGRSLRVEGLKININNISNLGVKYSTHVQDIGWQSYVTNGALAGTTGQSKRIEAIKIELTGTAAANYDIYYRVHSQTYGWLGWAKNGAEAGTAGYSKRMEAIEICLVAKGAAAPGSTSNTYVEKLNSISYSTHVQTYGWQSNVKDGETAGTTGLSKRLEAIKISLSLQQYSGSVQYRSHVQTYGWQSYVSAGALSGTSGQSKRLEAMQIKLTGEMANNYDIYYRVHSQNFGWMGWAKNGESAGTEGYSYRLEAIQIQLVKKGDSAPSGSGVAFKQK